MSAIKATVGICMGSQSDWPTMKHAADLLDHFGIPFEKKITSAHRTPKRRAESADHARDRGISIIIAGAGGAAHLPGLLAAHTTIPVLGVPIESAALKGMDSLLSIVQMPGGVPVGTFAIGKAGAINSALMAVSILSLNDDDLAAALANWRNAQTASIADEPTDA